MLHETISTRGPVALLVDAENFRADLAAQLLGMARGLGRVIVLRVYGQADRIRAWDDHGFRMCPTRPGKNSADMLLCVQAMSLALRTAFKTIVIASSDRDFTYLAEELRELGVTVVGVGSLGAAVSFQNSCSRFEVMGQVRAKALVPEIKAESLAAKSMTPRPKEPIESPTKVQKNQIIPLVRKVLPRSTWNGKWASVKWIEAQLKGDDPAFTSRSYGHPDLASLLRAVKYFNVDDTDKDVQIQDPCPKGPAPLPNPSPATTTTPPASA